MFRTARSATLAIAVGGALLLAGCADTSPRDPTGTGASESTASAPGAAPTPSGDGGCFVQLFDDDDLDESGSSFSLTEPGRYADLAKLPGAAQDWTEEADSLRVGPGATVTIWPETGFGGQAARLDPGSEHPHLRDEPASLELSCG